MREIARDRARSREIEHAATWQIAREHGLWDGKGLLDFTKAFSKGEYGHKYYSGESAEINRRDEIRPNLGDSSRRLIPAGRRMWDSLRHFKPSLALPGEYGDLKNDKPVHSSSMSSSV